MQVVGLVAFLKPADEIFVHSHVIVTRNRVRDNICSERRGRVGTKWADASELAPGDQGCRAFDWSEFEIQRIDSVTHPLFAEAYRRLWDEFGTKGELETEEVLARRMRWNPREPHDGVSLLYEMILVR